MNPFEWQADFRFFRHSSLSRFVSFFFLLLTEVKCTKLIIALIHFDNKFPSHSCPPVNKYSVIRGQDSHQFRKLFYNTDLWVQAIQIHLKYRSVGSNSTAVSLKYRSVGSSTILPQLIKEKRNKFSSCYFLYPFTA